MSSPPQQLINGVRAAVGDCPLFTMQLLVSVFGMALSAGMLAAGRDPAVYLPVLTSIIGYWLPAPKRPPAPAPPAPPPVLAMESVGSVGAVMVARRDDDTAGTENESPPA